MALLAASLASGCGAAISQGERTRPEPQVVDADVAFVHVTVVPMDTPREVPRSTVLVKEGRIVFVGPDEAARPGARARIIDGTGRFLMPGLADMHVHLNDETYLALLVANGVTTVRNMWGRPDILRWRTEIAHGERLGPTVHTSGSIVDGLPPVWEHSTVVRDAREATEVVDTQHAAGYDFIKVYDEISVEAYDAIAAESKRLGIPFAGHVGRWIGLAHALESHQKSIEHLGGYFRFLQRDDSPLRDRTDWPSLFRVSEFMDDAKIPLAVRLTREAGTWNCATLFVSEAWITAPDVKREWLTRPEMRYVGPDLRTRWRSSADTHARASRSRRQSTSAGGRAGER